MPHEVLWSSNANGYVRQLRSFLKNAPRVVRGNDHDDINNLGVSYLLSGGAMPRPVGDILHVAAEVGCPENVHRATCVAPGGNCAYTRGTDVDVTFNTAAKTIQATSGTTNWVANIGAAVGDLVRIDGASTAANNGVYRISAITTTAATNDTLTLETEDTLASSDAGDNITPTGIGGGAIFDVREDQTGTNTHIGWLASEVEFMAKDGSVWLFMRNGSPWAIGDYAQFELEAGAFSLYEDRAVVRTASFADNAPSADTIARTDYNGNWLRDGFEAGELVEVSGSASNDGVYLIDTVTPLVITLDAGETLANEAASAVTLIPRQRATVTFDDANAGFSGAPTIVRSAGSWLTRGYLPGGLIEVADAAVGGNDGRWQIESIETTTNDDDTLVLAAGAAIADSVGDVITCTPRNTILRAWSEHRYRWSATSGATGPDTQDLTNGGMPPVPNVDGNYTSEWVAIGPGDDPVNNPQTIYCGWQTQFLSSAIQNVEMRCADAVSDSSFNALGNTSPPTYIYLTLAPSMETFMVADGAHVTGFLDVNTSVTEWFYQGFCNIHGSQNQHPRPMINGGASFDPTGDRTAQGVRYQFFPKGVMKDLSGTFDEASVGSCWHRWVDGQWFPVGVDQLSSNDSYAGLTAATASMYCWPFYPTSGTVPTFPFDGGLQEFQITGGSALGNPQQRFTFFNSLRATPVTITPNPNREYPLLPVVLLMVNPAYNVVADLRNIYFTAGTGQATKNRIMQGGYTYMVGQNHEKTGQFDFCALRFA